MYVHTYVCREPYVERPREAQRGALRGQERPREARRGPERRQAGEAPERPRKAERSSGRLREAQGGPERPGEARRGPERASVDRTSLSQQRNHSHFLALFLEGSSPIKFVSPAQLSQIHHVAVDPLLLALCLLSPSKHVSSCD